ncbi:MAG: biotin/lipoyl-binding protein, partial [Hyphomicrobium sp.]|nr:biotin/lipoyl-binding protein [Hyphomicrobium sp.]
MLPLGALLVALALTACDRPQAQNKSQQTAPPPAVTTSQPVVSELVEWDEYTGRFEAVASVEVRARVSGYVDRIAFVDGQAVKKGDLLFVIDPRPFERALAQAQAELEQARTKAQNS